ncbi:MAG: DUF4034 domain-containing protein, partial [Candidatus Acidiferrales bacterium]
DQAQAQDADRLVEISRTYATSALPSAATPPTPSSKTQSAAVPVDDGPEYEYESQIMMYLVRNDYDSLDREARDARSRKVRFKGGPWKLYDFYEGISKPPSGDQATDEDWNLQIEALKAWVAARPESAAARIALAETYLSYGWRARGSGYADTVSDDGWNLFGQRVSMAASALVDAAKLKEKCPYWFEVMQQVALAQGWDKSQAKELLDAAMSFEPGFYHYYREYANFLLPKWNGDPADAPAFAEQISNQLGGQQGKFVYFEVSSTIVCGCNSDDDGSQLQLLSWPKIKDGYAALGQLYGYSNLKINRFAYMAVLEHDKPAAQPALAAIGDNWEPKVWHQQLDFLKAKAWAESQQGQ